MSKAICPIILVSLYTAAPALALKPELIVQTGHSAPVTSVTFSRDGKTIASASTGKTIKIWDVASGRELRTLSGHPESVNSVNFSPDGKTLASASLDKTIKLWGVTTGKELHTLVGHSDSVLSVAFSPDGKALASGSADNTIKLWDVAAARTSATFRGHSQSVTCVSFSPDGRSLASASDDMTIKLWDVTTGRELRRISGHSDAVFSVAFSPDGTTLASASGDNSVKLWDVATGRERHTLTGHSFWVKSVAFSADSKTLASASEDATIKLWDVATGQELRTLTGHSRPVFSVAFSPHGQTLASTSYDGTIKLWEVATGQELRTLSGQAGGVNSVALSPDNKTLALARYDDNTIKLWDLTLRRDLRTLAGHPLWVRSVAVSPDGKTLASASDDKTVKLWDIATGHELRTLSGHASSVNSVAFSPDHKILASASNDKTIKLWDVAGGRELSTLTGHSSLVWSVAFSPDGKTLVSASDDKTVKLWDVETAREARTLTGHSSSVNAVAFSPDNRTFASAGDDKTIRLWDATTGRELRTLTGHSDTVSSVSFSADGNTLASGSTDKSIKLWHVPSGRELHTLTGHSDSVMSVAFGPDGRTLASASLDTTIKLWDVATAQLIASLCSFGRNDWTVVDPAGRFDANNLVNLPYLCWRFRNSTAGQEAPVPIELFMAQYYTPRLLVRAMNREEFPKVDSIENLNLVRPRVSISQVTSHPGSADLVDVTVQYSSVQGLDLNSGNNQASGVYNLRLFRDGQLVGYLPKEESFAAGNRRDLTLGTTGKEFSQTFTVPLQHNGAAEVTFTAYAFNESKIKSDTASYAYRPPSPLPVVKGRAYVVAFGVNAYDDPRLRDLQCAAADARSYDTDFAQPLRVSGRCSSVTYIPLISDSKPPGANELPATKESLRAVIDALAGRVKSNSMAARFAKKFELQKTTADDFVLFAFSSHGETDPSTQEFYILPKETKLESSHGIGASLDRTAISSAELTDWLADVDAAEMVMIIDSCYSGAVAGPDFKPGPMDSAGLAQLAYYKQMRLLSASQADSTAQEFARLGHGLLTYALLIEGVGKRMADTDPQDGTITIGKLLRFAVAEVPRLDASSNASGFRAADARSAQDTLARRTKDVVVEGEDGKPVHTQRRLQEPSLLDFSKRIDFIIVGP